MVFWVFGFSGISGFRDVRVFGFSVSGFRVVVLFVSPNVVSLFYVVCRFPRVVFVAFRVCFCVLCWFFSRVFRFSGSSRFVHAFRPFFWFSGFVLFCFLFRCFGVSGFSDVCLVLLCCFMFLCAFLCIFSVFFNELSSLLRRVDVLGG